MNAKAAAYLTDSNMVVYIFTDDIYTAIENLNILAGLIRMEGGAVKCGLWANL